jgi:hypothetical protein
MKAVKLGICFLDEDDNIVVKHIVGSKWTIDADGRGVREYRIRVNEEIANIIFENLKLDLTPDNILSMLEELHKDV